eukprot:1874396-Prorocentrum_lima.AAC.1
MVKRRLERAIDHKIQDMQFGFRRNRSTGQALSCIRRVADQGERIGHPTYLLLLDWKQAFDK